MRFTNLNIFFIFPYLTALVENKKGLKHFKLKQEGLCNKNLASDGLSMYVNNFSWWRVISFSLMLSVFSFSSSISTEKSQKIFLLSWKIFFCHGKYFCAPAWTLANINNYLNIQSQTQTRKKLPSYHNLTVKIVYTCSIKIKLHPNFFLQ